MKLGYTLECAIFNQGTKPHYGPIGVWVQGPGSVIDVVVQYLPEDEDAHEEADWVISRLVEIDTGSLPRGFLEYHRATMSPYRGMRGETVETEEYATGEEGVVGILAELSRRG